MSGNVTRGDWALAWVIGILLTAVIVGFMYGSVAVLGNLVGGIVGLGVPVLGLGLAGWLLLPE